MNKKEQFEYIYKYYRIFFFFELTENIIGLRLLFRTHLSR
jgi:hypothetical protein